jgi:predicted amidohydrolase YtcJ
MLQRPYCVIVGTLFLVVASFSIAQVPTEAPDFVLLNGRVFTATEAAPGMLLFGMIGASAFFDPACTPVALDKIAPDRPVILSTWTPHAAMLNQMTAQKFAINPSDPPPLAGWFCKDMKSKTWDGVVHQSAWFRIFQALMTNRANEQAELQNYLDREARWGVTSITITGCFRTEQKLKLLKFLNA